MGGGNTEKVSTSEWGLPEVQGGQESAQSATNMGMCGEKRALGSGGELGGGSASGLLGLLRGAPRQLRSTDCVVHG